jgi:hypothetical protein
MSADLFFQKTAGRAGLSGLALLFGTNLAWLQQWFGPNFGLYGYRCSLTLFGVAALCVAFSFVLALKAR